MAFVYNFNVLHNIVHEGETLLVGTTFSFAQTRSTARMICEALGVLPQLSVLFACEDVDSLEISVDRLLRAQISCATNSINGITFADRITSELEELEHARKLAAKPGVRLFLTVD